MEPLCVCPGVSDDLIYKAEIEVENKHMVPKGEREGWDELEDWS